MILLGSTGSIGVNTLNIARKFNLNVEVLVAGRNIELLNQQIKEFKPKKVVIDKAEDIPLVHTLPRLLSGPSLHLTVMRPENL